MRFYLTQQIHHNFHIGFADWILFNTSGFIERKIEEVNSFQWNLIVCRSCTSFSTTNQSLNSQDITCIHISFFLLAQELFDFRIFVTDSFVLVAIKQLVESIDEMHETNHFFITYGNVSRSFIRYIYFMSLLYQTTERTSHRNHVIIWMRREYYHTFREWFSTFRTISIVCIRLTTRPSGNSMLQIIKDLDIYIISRTIKCQ